jgi:hypothetical protein
MSAVHPDRISDRARLERSPPMQHTQMAGASWLDVELTRHDEKGVAAVT